MTYRARANAIGYEMSGLDAGGRGADLLEQLAGSDAMECQNCA
jgi:hypothetical protein